MGLSSFPSAEGVLPILVMNTVLSVALLKNMLRSFLQVMGADNLNPPPPLQQQDYQHDTDEFFPQENTRRRRISITQFKSLTTNNNYNSCGGGGGRDCCVCLCGFEAEEEVSELSCKHFFHKGCLDKWIDNKHSTCPLCRSIL